MNHALAAPAVKELLDKGASDNLGPSTSAQADAFGKAERTRWVPFIRGLNIQT
ncbi:MAG: hypothetical protein KIS83_14100 [Rubrivivax sp.]|nr:hypothetical protein [Rubrivivax sp.]